MIPSFWKITDRPRESVSQRQAGRLQALAISSAGETTRVNQRQSEVREPVRGSQRFSQRQPVFQRVNHRQNWGSQASQVEPARRPVREAPREPTRDRSPTRARVCEKAKESMPSSQRDRTGELDQPDRASQGAQRATEKASQGGK